MKIPTTEEAREDPERHSKFPERVRPPAGVMALCCFFTFGAIISSLTCLALLFPGGPLEPMWRLKPTAHEEFLSMGGWAIGLMLAVGASCALSAYGLMARARWGYIAAQSILVVNLIGDSANAFIRGDLRTSIGLPIGGALLAYLLSPRVKKLYVRSQAKK